MRVTIITGCGFNGKRQADGLERSNDDNQFALRRSLAYLASQRGGCTYNLSFGSWLEGNHLLVEDGYTFIFEADGLQDTPSVRDSITADAHFIRQCFLQDSVVVSIQPSSVVFVNVE